MKTTSGITIDHVFEGYIPALAEEERHQLEQNIIEHGGARDPLVVWRTGEKDILLDGHNRYEICERLGLDYQVEPLEFDTRDDAADWIDRNQLGRRNLSKQDYKLLLGRRYNRAKKSAGAQEGNSNASKNEVDKMSTSKTAERIAKEHGVDEKTVRRAGKFQEAAAKLGIEKEIAAGKVKAPEFAVVKAAKALPNKPSKKDVEKAVKAVKATADKKPRGTVKAKGDFKALSPTKCLEAIEHYGREFLERCPNRYLELAEVLERLYGLVR
jgi:pyruvate/2-oxoglutarate dehydrogenase complex dihydrolipoamide acyltransferase (E2) component